MEIIDTDTAFEMTMDLARQNVISIHDDAHEHARQHLAIDTVHDFYLNNVAE